MRSLSRLLAALAATLGCAATLAAAPLVLEEQARLVPPDARYTNVSEVAVDGNRAVISAWRVGPQGNDSLLAAFLFERNTAGAWVPASTLLIDQPGSYVGGPDPVAVAVQGNIAAISWLGNLRIFERRSTGWVNAASIQNPPGAAAIGRDVEIEGDTVIVTGQGPGIRVLAYRRNSSGQWLQDGVMSAGRTQGIPPYLHGEDADIAGNLLVFGVPLDPELTDDPTLEVWGRDANGWNPRLPIKLGDARAVAFDGGTALVSGIPEVGMVKIRGVGSNMFIDSVAPQSTDAFMLGRGNRNFPTTFEWNSLAASRGLGIVGMFADDQRAEDAGSAHIYDITSSGGARPLARLLASDAGRQDFFGRRVEMSGRRVIVGARDAAYIYDLPVDFSQPAVITDDFENGNATQWTPIAGSGFSVVPSNSSLV